MSASKKPKRATGLHKVLAQAEMVQENYPCHFCGVGYGRKGPDEDGSLMMTCPFCGNLTCPDHRGPVLFRPMVETYHFQCQACLVEEVMLSLIGDGVAEVIPHVGIDWGSGKPSVSYTYITDLKAF